MASDTLPDVEFLREALSYDPETGQLRWRVRPASHYSSPEQCKRANGRFAGRLAGHAEPGRYVFVRLRNTKNYYAHRIVFKMMTGREPIEVDHINGNKSDNAWLNLREATPSQNKVNRLKAASNRSGKKGVSFHSQSGRIRARIKIDGRERHLGFFNTIEEAYGAYASAARDAFGEFWNPG